MVIGRVSNPSCVSREIRKSPVVVEPLTSGPQSRFARASGASPEPRSGDATSPSQEVPSVGILGTPRHRSPDDCRPQHDHGVARPPQVPDADAAPRFPLILRDERQMILVWEIAQATVTGRGATGGASRPVKAQRRRDGDCPDHATRSNRSSYSSGGVVGADRPSSATPDTHVASPTDHPASEDGSRLDDRARGVGMLLDLAPS